VRRSLTIGPWLLMVVLALVGCARVPPHTALPALVPGSGAWEATFAAHGRAPIVGGNRIDLLLNGEEIFPAVLDAIRAARRSITYAQYSYADGPVARDLVLALAERCRAGVGVSVLLDVVGTLRMPGEYLDHMRASGCHVVRFRHPARLTQANNRNHRRILVIDGRVGFTGGSGVSRKWMGHGRAERHWRETDVRVEGPVVEQLQAAFAEQWLEATGLVLTGEPYFPAPVARRGTSRAQVVRSTPAARNYAVYTTLMLAIASAQRSITITNPYFVPDDAMQAALVAALRRGVQVSLLLPGVIDHPVVRRISYTRLGPLLAAGARVYEYEAALLHAKTMVVDGVWATVGTTNLINRSFALDDEINLVVYDPVFAARLDAVFDDDLLHASRLTEEAWRDADLRQRLVELLAVPARALGAL
jgi:cardiolipin synthase